MAVLSYGKPTIEIAELDASDNMSPWVKIDVPKDGTTSMETQEGDNTEYLEEGGGLVDSYRKASKYSLNFELYAKKGAQKPINDVNGVISKNYAVRLTPEDPETYGFVLWKCSVSCVETHTVADGMMWKYTFNGLAAKDRTKIMDLFVAANNINTSANYLVFANTADSTGQTVTAEIGAAETLTASSSETWATTAVNNNVVTITVSANGTTQKREAVITLTCGTKTGSFKVLQAAGTSTTENND